MSDRTLVDLFDEIRGALLRKLEGVDEAAARWTPPGLSNHILWHAGHAYVVVEWLTKESVGQEPVVPEHWFELFSWESRPGEIPAEKFPSLQEVVERLKTQQQRLRQMFESMDEIDLRGAALGQPDRTVRQIIVHALQDEAAHKGEIWLLRKLHSLATRKPDA